MTSPASRRTIGVVTGSRADFGLLAPLLRELRDDPDLRLALMVTGQHLSPEFGLTFREITEAGFAIDERVEMLLSSDTASGISKSIGLGVIGFADVFARMRPDILVLLGDRFEILAAATAALNARIPMAHIHGGEATEGLIDEAIRHAITKMAHIHFTAAEPYRQRVIQLGEEPSRVFCFGAMALDGLASTAFLTREAFFSEIGLADRRPTFLVTYHPVTLEADRTADDFDKVLRALERFPDAQVLLTQPGADMESRGIASKIAAFRERSPGRVAFVRSLGQRRYMSALRHVDVMIGNSSSGLIEAPHFRLPVVNIGDRQRGRLAPRSILHCAADAEAIVEAIRKALSPDFKTTLEGMDNPYGSGGVSSRIKAVLKSVALDESLVKKRFYNIPVGAA